MATYAQVLLSGVQGGIPFGPWRYNTQAANTAPAAGCCDATYDSEPDHLEAANVAGTDADGGDHGDGGDGILAAFGPGDTLVITGPDPDDTPICALTAQSDTSWVGSEYYLFVVGLEGQAYADFYPGDPPATSRRRRLLRGI